MFRSLEGAGAQSRGLRLPLLASVALLLLAVMACGSAPPAPRAESPAPSSAPAGPPPPSTPAKEAAASVPAAAAAKPAAPAAQQTLTVAIGQVAKNLDPRSTASVTDYNFYRLVMDTLVSVDSGKPEPWLAESWTASDARNWRFKLRQGVRFTNGEEFDAEAVRFSLQRVLDDAKAPARYRIEMIEAINVVDRHTVEFRLKSPVANLPTRLSIFWIVPPKYTQEKGDGFATAPIGTGPFVVKEFQPSVSLTVEANPQYWGGAPKLQSIKFRPIPEASTRIAALQAGEADVIYGLLPEHVDLIKGKGFQIISSPVAITANLFFQQTTDTPLKDVRVRQAIDYAIDKDALLKALTGGHGGALDGQMVGKNSFGYDPSIKARPYDPAKAKQLLVEAGYPNGFSTTMDAPVGRYFRDKDVAEAVAGYLSQVGIKVQINALQGSVWLDKLYTGTWGPINFWGLQDAPAYDLAFTMELFRKNNLRKIAADDKFDELLDRTFTVVDPAQREQAYREVARHIAEQTFTVPLYHEPGLYAVSPKVRDLTFLPATYIELKQTYLAAQ